MLEVYIYTVWNLYIKVLYRKCVFVAVVIGLKFFYLFAIIFSAQHVLQSPVYIFQLGMKASVCYMS